MPKVTNTRAQRAAALVDRLNRGPSIDLTFFSIDHAAVDAALTPAAKRLIEEYLKSQYHRWVDTWVVPEVTALVPELKSK